MTRLQEYPQPLCRLVGAAGLCMLLLALGTTIPVAQATNLETLILTNGSLTVGDDVFSHFSLTIGQQLGDVSPSGGATRTAEDIAVGGVVLNGNNGIEFSAPFFALNSPESEARDIFSISYTV